ncbi:MAG: hypothetical protein HC902_02205 [Calothrix sp. SM1_5_4]|nr:hypothetical protein [Calothrix sp. SM1_5_4]
MSSRALLRLFAGMLLRIAGLVGILAIVASALIWWVVAHPNDAFRLAERYLLPKDLKISWAEIQWRPEKISWTQYRVDWAIKGLSIEKGSPKIFARVESLAARFTFSVVSPATRIEFAELSLRVNEPVLFSPRSQPAGTSDSSQARGRSPYQRIASFVNYLALGSEYSTLDKFDVHVAEVRIQPAGAEPVSFALDLRKPSADTRARSVQIALKGRGASFKLSFDGRLDASKLNEAEPLLVSAFSFEGHGADLRGEFKASFLEEQLKGQVKAVAQYRDGDMRLRLDPDLKVSLGEREIVTSVSTSVHGLPGPVTKLDKVHGRIVIPLTNGAAWSDDPGTFSFSTPLAVSFLDKATRDPLELNCQCQIPGSLKTDLSGKFWLKTLLAEATAYKRPAVDVRVQLEGMTNHMFGANLAAALLLSREGTVWKFEPRLDSTLQVHSFKSLKTFLDAKNVIIPAPFDALDGTLELVAKGAVSHGQYGSRTPIKMAARLASEHQNIDLDSTLVVDLAKNFRGVNLFLNVLIREFRVELPPLDPIAGMPEMTRDKRILLEPSSPAPRPSSPPPAFKVNFFFALHTASSGAIRLLSKLATPYIPITVALDRTLSGGVTGSVKFEPFDIRYLRRTVHMEQMRVLMDESGSGDYPVDGRFRVDQTQYKIYIDVSGTLRSPSVKLSSDPYLDRSEIVSVLLYDRTSDRLAGSDAQTVGDFQAAMADRAIGLFGLWALASTPIRSFSYNPATKVYSATVQLADGLTAGVGTNWEEAAHFELRKRVSRSWILTASWVPGTAEGRTRAQVGRLVLQWEKRF